MDIDAANCVGLLLLGTGETAESSGLRPRRTRRRQVRRMEMLDMEGDGDLDLMTCEERGQLGVIWHENPTR